VSRKLSDATATPDEVSMIAEVTAISLPPVPGERARRLVTFAMGRWRALAARDTAS
jgi:hypothetical protein